MALTNLETEDIVVAEEEPYVESVNVEDPTIPSLDAIWPTCQRTPSVCTPINFQLLEMLLTTVPFHLLCQLHPHQLHHLNILLWLQLRFALRFPMSRLCSAELNFLEKKAQGCNLSGSLYTCNGTTPKPTSDASTSTINFFIGSGNFNTGTVMNSSLSF